MEMLNVGDTVLWRGSWGTAAPQATRVTDIEKTAHEHEKYGEPVDAIAWVDARRCVVSLSNGHWAYGYQLLPVRN